MDYCFPSWPLILPSQYSSIMHGTNDLLHCKDCKAKDTLNFNLRFDCLEVNLAIKKRTNYSDTLIHVRDEKNCCK